MACTFLDAESIKSRSLHSPIREPEKIRKTMDARAWKERGNGEKTAVWIKEMERSEQLNLFMAPFKRAEVNTSLSKHTPKLEAHISATMQKTSSIIVSPQPSRLEKLPQPIMAAIAHCLDATSLCAAMGVSRIFSDRLGPHQLQIWQTKITQTPEWSVVVSQRSQESIGYKIQLIASYLHLAAFVKRGQIDIVSELIQTFAYADELSTRVLSDAFLVAAQRGEERTMRILARFATSTGPCMLGTSLAKRKALVLGNEKAFFSIAQFQDQISLVHCTNLSEDTEDASVTEVNRGNLLIDAVNKGDAFCVRKLLESGSISQKDRESALAILHAQPAPKTPSEKQLRAELFVALNTNHKACIVS